MKQIVLYFSKRPEVPQEHRGLLIYYVCPLIEQCPWYLLIYALEYFVER